MSDDYQTLAQRLAGPLWPWIADRITGYRRGTAFPASPAAGDRFFRTDLGFACFYDGARWLTVHEYSAPFVETSSGAAFAPRAAIRTDYALYWTRVSLRAFVATTNNGTNYWNIVLQSLDAQITTGTNLYSKATNADGAGAWLVYDAACSTNIAAAGNIYWARVNCAPVGAPGALTLNAVAYYRLIVP